MREQLRDRNRLEHILQAIEHYKSMLEVFLVKNLNPISV